jgi:hypothetical protein
MSRSPGAALLTACVFLAVGCGGAEERTAPSRSGPSVSASTTASSAPIESPTPPTSAGPTRSPAASSSAGRTWHRSFDVSVEAVATGGDGNAYLTGFSPSGRSELWGEPVAMDLLKFGPGGERSWVRRWGSRSQRYPHAAGFDVALSRDGSVVYVAGAVMNDSTEVRRGRLWAYSPEGSLLWSVGTARHVMTAAAASSNGVVAGGGGSLGAWDADGNRLWVRRFEEPAEPHCDVLEDLAVGNRDEVYAVGFLDTTPTCGSIEGGAFEDADVVIQKRAASGEPVWSTVLTDPGVTDNDWAYAVDVAGEDVFVAGEVDGLAWLALVSTDAEVVWERSWGGSGARADVLDAAPWGVVYVTSFPDRVRRFTLEGDVTWQRRLRLPEEVAVSGLAIAPGRALYLAAGGGFSTFEGVL